MKLEDQDYIINKSEELEKEIDEALVRAKERLKKMTVCEHSGIEFNTAGEVIGVNP